MAYNATIGNLAIKAGVSCTYQPAHPHAATSAGGSYTYDANGNMLTRTVGGQSYTFAYDAEGHLTGVTGSATATFIYDGDGKRVKGVINSVNTLFVGNYYEKTGSTITKYYYAGATRIAARTGSTLTYLLGDHLGSTSLATDSSGALLMETRYKPFGEVRYATPNGTLPTRYTFTGQYSYVSDEATDAAGFGLIYFNARWLDPGLGRFAQSDTIVPDPYDPQDWDRYSYSGNNPLSHTDPTGHLDCPSVLKEICESIGLWWLEHGPCSSIMSNLCIGPFSAPSISEAIKAVARQQMAGSWGGMTPEDLNRIYRIADTTEQISALNRMFGTPPADRVEDSYRFAVQSRQEQLDQFTKEYFGDGLNVIYGGDQGPNRFGVYVDPGDKFGGTVYDRPTIVVFEDAFRNGWGEVGTTILHELLEEYRGLGLSHEEIYDLERLWKEWYNQ